jgi:hypothetical protein
MSLILEQIERRARIEHGGDMNKAAEEYFRDHPEYWEEYVRETAVSVGATVKD